MPRGDVFASALKLTQRPDAELLACRGEPLLDGSAASGYFFVR
jgi:hypothetical protein